MIIAKTKIKVYNFYYGLYNVLPNNLSIAEIVALAYEKIKRIIPNIYFRILNLSYTHLDATDVTILLASAVSTKRHKFSLSHHLLSAAGTKAIMLQGTLINTLELCKTGLGVYNRDGLGAAGIKALVLQNTLVHTLNLSGNKLGIAGVRALGLRKTIVQTLNIANCNLTAVEVRSLMRVLIGTQVNTIVLDGNKLGVAGARILIALISTTQIHTLSLKNTSLRTDGLIVLLAGLKGSKVTKVNGINCSALRQVLQDNLARKQDAMIALGNVAAHSNNRLPADVVGHIASFLSVHNEVGNTAVAAMDRILAKPFVPTFVPTFVSEVTFKLAQLAYQRARYNAYIPIVPEDARFISSIPTPYYTSRQC